MKVAIPEAHVGELPTVAVQDFVVDSDLLFCIGLVGREKAG
jgi:hypothetical protein